jgi:hypothetical protein
MLVLSNANNDRPVCSNFLYLICSYLLFDIANCTSKMINHSTKYKSLFNLYFTSLLFDIAQDHKP